MQNMFMAPGPLGKGCMWYCQCAECEDIPETGAPEVVEMSWL